MKQFRLPSLLGQYRLAFLWALALSFSLSSFANAQSLSVRGIIQDATGPLPIATVMLKTAADSTLVKAGVTDNSGVFTLSSIPKGQYRLFVNFVGMEPYTSEVLELDKISLTLPPITLKEASETLEEVTVVAEKPIIEVQADKTVFNVEGTISATGSNGMELLRKAPGVIIDNNNNIILEGKTGVQIFVNGKPSPLQGDDLQNFLRSLQADDIEAIEIITQPSSKYDAAGTAGIINIKLKKDKGLGTNGSIALGYAQGKNSRYNGSVSLNNRSKYVNLFGSYSLNTGKNWNETNLDREQNGERFNSQSETVSDNLGQNFRFGADFYPNSKHTIGILARGNIYDYEYLTTTTTPISAIGENDVNEVLQANNQAEGDNLNILGNLNYRFADTLGHEFGIDVDYGVYQRDEANFQPNLYTDEQGNPILTQDYYMVTPTNIDIFSAKVDYSQKALGGKLGIGAKYSKVATDNTFEFFDVFGEARVLNEDRSNTFDYTEEIQAAYVNYNTRFGKKFNLQAGLRVERTLSEGILTSNQDLDNENVTRDYTNVFPSGGLTYTPNQSHSLALTYSKRIERPNYRSLNPFENQLDELSIRRGNPFLQPQYTDNIKLSHTYKYRFTTSVSYSYVSGFFAQVTEQNGERGSAISEQNIADQETWNLGFSAPFGLAKWWEVYLSANVFHNSYKANSNDDFKPIEQATFNLYAQNTFSLPRGVKFEVSGWFNSPSVWGGTYVTKSQGSLNLAVQKKFMEDRLTVRVSANDILYTAPWKADMEFGGLRIRGNGAWESQQVRVNLSYNFGSKEIKGARRRRTATEGEEGNRLGGD